MNVRETVRNHGLHGEIAILAVTGTLVWALGFSVEPVLAVACVILYGTVTQIAADLFDLGPGGFEILYAIGCAVGVTTYVIVLVEDAIGWVLLVLWTFCAWLALDGLQQHRRGDEYWRTGSDPGRGWRRRLGRRLLAPILVELDPVD